MYDRVASAVKLILGADKSGHGYDHVERVRALAEKFAESENADRDVVILAALLHDVDDYKIFGKDSAENLTNAKQILAYNEVEKGKRAAVLDIIKNMGYNKYLNGVRPATIEGAIVSDADMCDAIGAEGILRTHAYALSKGNEFFDPTISPKCPEFEADNYRAAKKSHSAQHFFDKLLLVPSIMMTDAGRAESYKRQKIMVDFLRELFREQNSAEWSEYLENFLAQQEGVR